MGLFINTERSQALRRLWLAGAEGLPATGARVYRELIENLLCESFTDATRVFDQRFRLTEFGWRVGQMLFDPLNYGTTPPRRK